MKEHDVYVKKSPIDGMGVFAARDFKKGETILKWDTSETLTEEQVKDLSNVYKKYVYLIDGKYTVQQVPARYVNHSRDPNTTVINFSDVAIKDIKKNNEITSDCSSSKVEEPIICKCGSSNCRGIIKRM
ncbi:MAG: SET domain-containing protein-lysine N-methyltransferase [Patescibacteria group bacterium]